MDAEEALQPPLSEVREKKQRKILEETKEYGESMMDLEEGASVARAGITKAAEIALEHARNMPRNTEMQHTLFFPCA